MTTYFLTSPDRVTSIPNRATNFFSVLLKATSFISDQRTKEETNGVFNHVGLSSEPVLTEEVKNRVKIFPEKEASNLTLLSFVSIEKYQHIPFKKYR